MWNSEIFLLIKEAIGADSQHTDTAQKGGNLCVQIIFPEIHLICKLVTASEHLLNLPPLEIYNHILITAFHHRATVLTNSTWLGLSASPWWTLLQNQAVKTQVISAPDMVLKFRTHPVVHRNKHCGCSPTCCGHTFWSSRQHLLHSHRKSLQGTDGWRLFLLPVCLSQGNSNRCCNVSDLWLNPHLTVPHPSENKKFMSIHMSKLLLEHIE